jgi:type II secretory pathway component PulL
MSSVIQAEFKAYSTLIAIGVALMLAALVFFSGCHVQKKHDAAKVALVEKQRDDSYISLVAAGKALDDVNAQAARNIAQAKASEAAAEQAGKSATIAEQAAKQQVDTFKARLVKASKAPACESLLNMNVGATCAIASH